MVFSVSVWADESNNKIRIGVIDQKTHKIKKISEVTIDEYIAGVISREIPDSWPVELKKAFTVCIRSWVYSNRERHKEEGFDFCNLTHCQAWERYDLKKDKYNLNSILEETADKYLFYKGRVVSGFYHSTCGGCTALAHDVFIEEYVPNLKARWDGPPKDHNCKDSPHYIWNSFISNADIEKIIKKILKRNISFEYIYISQRDRLGKRAKRITIVLDKGIKIIKAYDFWMAAGGILGWNMIKSTYFDIVKKDDGYLFIGHGNGHGIGLCQWGAKKLADNGYGWEKILKYYFPKCRITSRK